MNTVEGGLLSAKDLSLLESGENLAFAARPTYATALAGRHWSLPLFLLTDRRLIISKEKMFGKRHADFAVGWSEVTDVSGGLWNGGGPQIQLVIGSNQGSIELIVDPQYAVDVESAIRARYLAARSGDTPRG